MTTAPISVERLRELLAKATPTGEWRFSPMHIEEGEPAIRCLGYGIVATAATDAQAELIAVMHEALPALLAECERLRQAVMYQEGKVSEWCIRASAAERARDEATGLLRRVNASLYLLDKPHREFGGVTDKTATDIAALLAASGGA